MEAENKRTFSTETDILNFPMSPIEDADISKQELLSSLVQVRELIHDASQPLTTILTLLDMLRYENTLEESSRADINLIFKEALALRNIMQTVGRKLHQTLPR